MSRERGSRPKKTDDGWCGRRIRKSARGVGKLSPLDVCPVHSSQVLAEVARVSYMLRKRRVPPSVVPELRRVRTLLGRLVPRIPPPFPRPLTGVPEAVTPPPAPVLSHFNKRSRLGLGHPDRVEFVSGGLLADEVVSLSFTPRRRTRPSGGVLRLRGLAGVASDARVAGTFLEGPKSREKREYLNDLSPLEMRVPLPVLRETGPRTAKVSDLELKAAIQTMVDDSFVEKVRAQAPPELAALLAGESWGVMKF
jgi:hypothetical protein